MPSEDTAPSSAMHRLYRDNHGWLQRLIYKRLGCSFDAADLSHDVFLRVFAGRDISAIREPRPYLVTIARGLLANHFRRRELERAYLAALANLPEPMAPDPAMRWALLETLIAIDKLLDGLPGKVRRAFLLSQLDGLTYAEIAERLDVSHSSVKQYMLKAVQHCMGLQE